MASFTAFTVPVGADLADPPERVMVSWDLVSPTALGWDSFCVPVGADLAYPPPRTMAVWELFNPGAMGGGGGGGPIIGSRIIRGLGAL